MTNQTITRKENKTLESLLRELREIKQYLKKFLVIIPEESLKEYENASEVKKAYKNALKSFPPPK